MMAISYRPLGLIVEMIEGMDLEVTYAYEDLVFISHNAFLLRMGQQVEQIHLYFNQESNPADRLAVTEQLIQQAKLRGFTIIDSGTFVLKPREDEQLDIHFYEITQ